MSDEQTANKSPLPFPDNTLGGLPGQGREVLARTPIILFCAFTREWAVDDWLLRLSRQNHDPALTSLCFIVDDDDPGIKRRLEVFAEEHKYRHLEIIMNVNNRPNEMRLDIRRHRIAEVKEQSKKLVARCDGEIVISLEDDTMLDDTKPDSLLELAGMLDDKVAFVEGVQIGRWGAKIVGAWSFDDVFMPRKVNTIVPPRDHNIANRKFIPDMVSPRRWEYITAGGFYGYATTKALYCLHDYSWSSSQPWGPDVNYGVWLRQRGYKCLIDWDVVFGHNDRGAVGWPHEHNLTQVTFTRSSSGQWLRSDLDENTSRY